MDQDVLDARAKLAARFGTVQVGGKGTSHSFLYTYKLKFNRPFLRLEEFALLCGGRWAYFLLLLT